MNPRFRGNMMKYIGYRNQVKEFFLRDEVILIQRKKILIRIQYFSGLQAVFRNIAAPYFCIRKIFKKNGICLPTPHP